MEVYMSPVSRLPGSSGHWKDLYKVSSNSRPGVSYVVARSDSGTWGCSCPAWTFHTPRLDCKHITQVRRQLNTAAPLRAIPAAEVAADEKLQKALSRFALVEL